MTAPGAAVQAPTIAPEGQPRGRGAELALWIFLGVAVTLIVGTAYVDGPSNLMLGVTVVALLVITFQRFVLSWQTMLAAILLVIIFIPIRRYSVGGGGPIALEPYRVVIALVIGCWLCALAADPKVRWRRTGLEGPLGVLLVVMLLSMAANVGRVNAASSMVIKQFSFFLSYIILIYFIVSVVRARRDLDRVLRILVGGGAVIALASLIEWRTGSNLFNWYGRVIPFLHYVDEGIPQTRGSGFRARATAQHPIAFSAAAVVLLPLAIYLYQRDKRKIWLACAGLLTLGALATGSRTGTSMLIAVLVSFIVIKPREALRLWKALLAMVIVIQIVMPGTLGTMKSMLNPSYVIKEQSFNNGGGGTGRVADLGPALAKWSTQPFLGSGFGTKVAEGNAKAGSDQQILDDQWLGSLLEIGLCGVLALLWLYGRAIRRLTRLARSDTGPDGWLGASLATSIIAFAVGMLTFDAFAFVQVTFFSFIMLALAAVVIVRQPVPVRERQPARPLAPAIAAR